MKKIIFIASLFTFYQANAQNCFLVQPKTYGTATGPTGVTSADFNGDGNLDLATANSTSASGSSNISILLGTGTGVFGTSSTVLAGVQPISVTSADFNGDGKADIAAANSVSNNVSVLLGNGNGGFGVATNFAVGTKPYCVISADFNHDGKADIVTANRTSGTISVLLGSTGTGNFSAAVSYSVGTLPESVTTGDFNGDNILDLAVANSSSNNVSVLLGTGNGSFGTPSTFSVGTTPECVITVDFNSDNILDLATANSGSGDVSILIGSGSANYNTAVSYTTASGSMSLCSADFNGDGIMDIITSNTTSNNAALIIGTGTGTFGTSSVIPVGTSPKTIISADLNKDNKPDFVTANINSANVTVALNAPIVTADGSATICLGDVTTMVANGVKGGTHRYTWNPNTNLTTILGSDSSVVASPTTTTVYTVTGTATNGCKGVSTVTVTVATPTITVNSPTICVGNTATLTANGANTYTWSTNETTAIITPSPTTTTNYTVTGKNSNNCTNTYTTMVTVNSLPTISVNSATICIGSAATLTATGANTFVWNTSATTASISVMPTSQTNYTVTGTDANNCTNTYVTSVYVNSLPTVTVNSPTVCFGTMALLTASGANTYTWSTSATTNTIAVTPTATTVYTVTGTDVNTCTNVATATVTAPANLAPAICMVSTNSPSFVNNVISWDKTLYTNADSFIVYRYDISSSSYLKVGTVSKDSSQFTDTQRNIGGPNGGDPSLSSWRYKLAVKDTCGNVSPLSKYHETMYIQQINQSITWSAYNVEAGQTNPITGYQVLRDSLGNGIWHVLVNTLGTSVNDANYAMYPNAVYRVDALGFLCNTATKAHSNLTKAETVGIKELFANQTKIYPNPSNGSFIIEQGFEENQIVKITDLNGNAVYTQTINGTTTINTNNLAAGIYNLSIIGNKSVVNKKLIIVN